MKKILILVLSALAFSAFAKETVTIIYAFSPADSIANYDRTLVEEANRIQDKYTFLFDTKPGAGNAIAANYVKNTPNTILATSSAFFIRPIFYPNESYNIADFQELMPQCDAPLSVSSARYRTWADVPKDRPLNMGVSGLGTTTHLTALQIVKKYPNIQVVPFKSTNDSMLSTVAGTTDFHVGFLSESELWASNDGKKLNILGVSGSAPQHLVVPKSVSADKFREWRAILVRAAQARSVRDAYAVDHCQPLDQMPDNQIQAWYYKSNAQWHKLSQGVSLDK